MVELRDLTPTERNEVQQRFEPAREQALRAPVEEALGMRCGGPRRRSTDVRFRKAYNRPTAMTASTSPHAWWAFSTVFAAVSSTWQT